MGRGEPRPQFIFGVASQIAGMLKKIVRLKFSHPLCGFFPPPPSLPIICNFTGGHRVFPPGWKACHRECRCARRTCWRSRRGMTTAQVATARPCPTPVLPVARSAPAPAPPGTALRACSTAAAAPAGSSAASRTSRRRLRRRRMKPRFVGSLFRDD